MIEPVSSIMRGLLEALNFPAMLATAAASSVVVFSENIRSAVGEIVWIISLLVFIFAIVWLLAKSVEWAFQFVAGQRKLRGNERAKLYFRIDSLLGYLSGITGSWELSESARDVSAQIAAIYAQLRHFGVPTPELDPSDPTTNLDDHIAFLVSLKPFIAGAPPKALRSQSSRLIQKIPKPSR